MREEMLVLVMSGVLMSSNERNLVKYELSRFLRVRGGVNDKRSRVLIIKEI